jgi:phosphoglycerol transferase MdoB-like AlkP superfamily enzyme
LSINCAGVELVLFTRFFFIWDNVSRSSFFVSSLNLDGGGVGIGEENLIGSPNLIFYSIAICGVGLYLIVDFTFSDSTYSLYVLKEHFVGLKGLILFAMVADSVQGGYLTKSKLEFGVVIFQPVSS